MRDVKRMSSVDCSQYERVLGIDPDLVKSGVAIWKGKELLDLKSLSLLDLFTWIQSADAAGVLFVLEDVEANKPVFRRKGQNIRQMQRIAQNVGQVKAIARQIRQVLDQVGAEYVMVPPLKGPMKQPKRNAELFKKMTGWQGSSNEDKRDAAMLALYVIRGGRGQVFLQEAA